jgi:hypothetical protein
VLYFQQYLHPKHAVIKLTWNPCNKNHWQHSFLLDGCSPLPFGSGITCPQWFKED